jgi:hypothetical protein
VISVQTVIKIIGIVIIFVFVWLLFNPAGSELRTKQKETLLKKRIEKSVEEIKVIDKELRKSKKKDDY